VIVQKPHGNLKWTLEALGQEMMKYATKKEFIKANRSAYFTSLARFPMLCELFYGDSRKWTKEENVFSEAVKYETIRKFQEGSYSAYKSALEKFPHILDLVFERKRVDYTEQSMRDELLKYQSRAELKFHKGGAYYSALRKFPHLIDEIFPERCDKRDDDTVYVWKAVGQSFNGNPVYKIGVTSHRLGQRRIKQVAKEFGFDFEIIVCQQISGKATKLEKCLHQLGENPKYLGKGGRTEFRALSDESLKTVLTLISEWRN